MAKTVKEERLRWVLPIVRREVRRVDVARVCPHSVRSLERWGAAYRAGGEDALEPHSTRPKTHPAETAIAVKERIREIRKRTRLCALKIKWQLEGEGIAIHERTIGKILKAEQLVRRYLTRRVKYRYVRAARQPGELVEIDVKYVPGRVENKRYFQYTAIDCASRWRHLAIYDEQSNYHSIQFLGEVLRRFPHPVRAVKTDNGCVFTNRYTGTYKRLDRLPAAPHHFDRFCARHGIVHYLIDPGKPAQNGMVERSHRSDQEAFYDRTAFFSVPDLRRKARLWNMRYNDLAHCGLNGKSPNQFLTEYAKANPPNVRA